MRARKKGFTLIEMIVVIAIIGVLAAILVPAMMGYIKRAKQTSTVGSAKTIHSAVTTVIAVEDDAQRSFYNKDGNHAIYECTPEGDYVRTLNGSGNSKFTSRTSDPDNYIFVVVARADGYYHSDRDLNRVYNTWNNADNSNYTTFAEKLCDQIDVEYGVENKKKMFPFPMAYRDRTDGGSKPLVRWLVGYRRDEPEKIEIWAGDGTFAKNGICCRVYPNPSSNYTD